MGIRPGDRVIAYDGLGRAFPGTAIGQVTKDPEGYWAVHLDRQDPEDRIACRLQDMTRVYEL